MAILADIGVDWRDRNLTKEVYINQKACVMVGETLSDVCNIGTRVKQGCSLSPFLFSIHDEAVVREVCQKCAIGIRVGERWSI